ncbi:hypothetical protein Patl1_02345 [Pistacia atlantica]|uniref:Uncharacterized protein n=1 Tax=Pistacia atlantica TaxID=434234 RepID=A0ACC1C851_9ROSI|nr:hypothetical protein Patl1_02345 [Pistacia atlantica]
MHKLMESLYNNKSSKIVKLNSQNGGVSPLMMKFLGSNSASSCSSGSRSRSSVDPFSPLCGNSNSNSPLSGVFDEDDVLVMDGITVNSPSSGSNSADFYKTELCRSWEDLGKCRFGIKCQFAHGKYELRPTRFSSIKNKSEAQICKAYITGSCVYGAKCRFVHPVIKTRIAATMVPEKTTTTKTSINPITLKLGEDSQNPSSSTTKENWSPLDDGIEVASLPSRSDNLSREKIDAYIDSVLYCPSARKRLAVFADICPD